MQHSHGQRKLFPVALLMLSSETINKNFDQWHQGTLCCFSFSYKYKCCTSHNNNSGCQQLFNGVMLEKAAAAKKKTKTKTISNGKKLSPRNIFKMNGSHNWRVSSQNTLLVFANLPPSLNFTYISLKTKQPVSPACMCLLVDGGGKLENLEEPNQTNSTQMVSKWESHLLSSALIRCPLDFPPPPYLPPSLCLTLSLSHAHRHTQTHTYTIHTV